MKKNFWKIFWTSYLLIFVGIGTTCLVAGILSIKPHEYYNGLFDGIIAFVFFTFLGLIVYVPLARHDKLNSPGYIDHG